MEANAERLPAKLGYGPFGALFVTVGSYYASQLLTGVVLGWAGLVAADASKWSDWLTETNPGRFVTIALFELLTLGIIWAYLRHKRTHAAQIGLKPPQPRDILYVAVGYVVYQVLALTLLAVMKYAAPHINWEQAQEIGFSAQQQGRALVWVFLTLVIVPPIAEEIVCRGFLYTGLKSKWPHTVAVLVTSLLFAAAHLQFGSGRPLLWVAALDTFVLSLVLIYLRDKTDSLAAPIMLHMLKNGIAFSVLFIFTTV